ncbi:NAD-dependent epimerase/dehydratase family protein [Puniceicoccales bacterium CK1056]|uniref:NAD-dependent epimerase/dehydratase family protein n=1 Tax=Oceanipulchritudo coccoides TaxID=2706888 RepID=A0A6B2M3C9_9BACT|nr:NAD-dependent epimerase/dehydratase family protein [Oceanipulchritudo coccoides]NDV62315.1 NAD-dependent epimerase/dehydratase family protein [Oceanipulchritudo coccoides]
MKILITGICGFVGSTLAKAIHAAHPDWEIVGIDNFSRSGSWRNRDALEDESGVRFFTGDIRSQTDLEMLPACDWVIDAAANPSVLAGVDGKTSSRQLVEYNLYGTVNLLEYCKQHQAGFILLSTSRVYSIPELSGLRMEVENLPKADGKELRNRYIPDSGQHFPAGISVNGVSEKYSIDPPVSLYGSTKVASEHLALEYGATFDFPVWINRCGVLSGAGQFGHPAQGIFAFWIHSFREGKPLKYIGFDGMGRQVRDCLHPRDILPLLEKQFSSGDMPETTDRVINLAGGLANSMSLAELTHWCQARFPGSQTGTPASSPEVRRFDLPWVVLDCQKASELWEWQPQTPIGEVLEEIASFAEKENDWLNVAK